MVRDKDLESSVEECELPDLLVEAKFIFIQITCLLSHVATANGTLFFA